jgi:hypothetical protein
VDNTPVWKGVDLLEDGVLTQEVEDEIGRKIDEMCRAEDAARRARFVRAPDKPSGGSKKRKSS